MNNLFFMFDDIIPDGGSVLSTVTSLLDGTRFELAGFLLCGFSPCNCMKFSPGSLASSHNPKACMLS